MIETAEASLADSYVYDDEHDGKRDSDEVTAINQLDDVSAGDGNMLDGYLSRSDFVTGMDTIKLNESNLNGSAACEELGEQQKKAVELRNQGSMEYTYEYYETVSYTHLDVYKRQHQLQRRLFCVELQQRR